jgi:hypothetical protein
MTAPRYSFTQPICGPCYAYRYPDREPHQIIEAEAEICCVCGLATRRGIYLRVDPSTVLFPSRLKEDG